MAFEDKQAFDAFCIPDPDGVVMRRGSQTDAVVRKSAGSYATCMALEYEQTVGTFCIPKPDCVITRRGSQALAII